MAGGVGLFVLFLLGIYIGLPKMLDSGTETPGIAHGRPAIEDARKTPTPEPYQTAAPTQATATPRAPRLAPSPEISMAYVIQDGAPAHQAPGPTAPKLYTLRYGDKVRPLERKEMWERVLLPDGRPAWVQQSFLSATRPADLPQDGESGAVKAVNAFYQDVNDHRLSQAYDRLSFEWKRALPFTTFANGYAATTQAACTVTSVTPVDADHVSVQISLQTAERRLKSTWSGTYVVVRERGDWKLDSGDLRETTPAQDPTEEEDLE